MDYLDSRAAEYPQVPGLDPVPARLPRPARRTAIRLAREFVAAPGRVFSAWLDPKIASRWLFATAWRPMTPARIDARVGGAFRFVERYRLEHAGVYVLIVPPRRLVFTLSSADRMRETQVTVEIVPRKSGCRLALTHLGVTPDEVANMKNRWTGMLYGLDTILNGETR